MLRRSMQRALGGAAVAPAVREVRAPALSTPDHDLSGAARAPVALTLLSVSGPDERTLGVEGYGDGKRRMEHGVLVPYTSQLELLSNVPDFCCQQLSSIGRRNHKLYYTTLAYSCGRRAGAAVYSTDQPCDDPSQLTLQQQVLVRQASCGVDSLLRGPDSRTRPTAGHLTSSLEASGPTEARRTEQVAVARSVAKAVSRKVHER